MGNSLYTRVESNSNIEQKEYSPLKPSSFLSSLESLRSHIPVIWTQEIEKRRNTASPWEKESFGGGGEVVTEADVSSSLRLLKLVKETYPSSLSEEHLSSPATGDDFWLFDPLDGTACFSDDTFISVYWNKIRTLYAERSSVWKHLRLASPDQCRLSRGETLLATFFTQKRQVLIPISGVVYSPLSQGESETLWWCDAKRFGMNKGVVSARERTDKDSPLRIGVSPYMESQTGGMKLTEYLLDVFEAYFAEKIRNKAISSIELVPYGASGDGIHKLLQGKLDIVLHPYRCCKVWDVAPGVALLRHCGGSVSDFWGKKITSFPDDSFDTDPRQKGGAILSRGLSADSFVDYLTLTTASLFRDLGFID
jgi:fructose-1,6-bisphosphatase/inositol monophosphatase family enzyme